MPLLSWGLIVGTPVPFLLLLCSLPFVPCRGKQQFWLVLQALSVGGLLALSWVTHQMEITNYFLGTVCLLLVIVFLYLNLRKSMASQLVPFVPGILVLVIVPFVLQNENSRPIDADSFRELLATHEQATQDGDAVIVTETTKLIKESVVAGMIEKGYSASYSRSIARDTPLEYLVPLTIDWNLRAE